MLELLVQMACQPVKPEGIEMLLKIWLQSAKWNADAKSFVNDKGKRNKEAKKDKDGDEPMLGLQDHITDVEWTKKFIFDDAKIASLIKRTNTKFTGYDQLAGRSADDLPIVFDKRLLEQVFEKQRLIQSLKSCKADILEKQHKVEELQRYIAAIEMIDNYDLEDCRKAALDKLEVIKQCLLLTQVN